MAVPKPTGVETFFQLRSADSPAVSELDFDAPGSDTRVELVHQALQGASALAGARVTAAGRTIATVAPPAAWDSDGVSVPVSYTVEGSRLQVHVDHAGGDYRYPILVDPYVEEYFTNLADPDTDFYGGRWIHYSTLGNRLAFGTNADGLVILGGYNNYYTAGEWGEWAIQAYPKTRIVVASFNEVKHTFNYTCVDEFIMGNDLQKQGNGRTYCQTLAANRTDVCSDAVDPCNVGGATDQNWAVFRLRFLATGNLPGVAYASLKNSVIKYYEPYRPTISGLTPAPDQTNWYDKSGFSYSFRIQAHDDGMGLQQLKWQGPNGLSGAYTQTCSTGRDGRCPPDLPTTANPTTTWTYTGSQLNEGVNRFGALAVDVILNPSSGPWQTPTYEAYTWVTKIDNTAPTLTPSGTLLDNDGKIVTGNSYALRATNSDPYSGGGDIQITVNGVPQPKDAGWHPCSGDGCSSYWDYTFPATKEGLNTILIQAWDKIGHKAGDRTIKVIVDRVNPTVSVTQQDIPTEWTATVDAHTSVTGSDAGAGVKRAKIVRPAPRAPLSRDFSTCSGAVADPCPANPPATTFDYTEADLDDGENTLWATTEDAAVRTSAQSAPWTIKLDRGGPQITPSGTLYQRRNQANQPVQPVLDGQYDVHVHTTDGDPASPGAGRRSGVVEVELRLDGDVEESVDVPCDTHSCALDLDWTVDTSELDGGDHRVDLLARDAVGNEATDHFEFTKSCCLDPPSSSLWTSGAPKFGDVTGDNLDDAVGRDALGQMQVAAANGDGFDQAVAWGPGPATADFQLGDADEDGFSDLLWHDTVTGELKVSLSSGSGFQPATTWGTSSVSNRVLFGDVDGDGQADAVSYNATTGVISAQYSLGDSFDAPFNWATWNTAYDLALADVTGDTAADAIGRNPSGQIQVAVSTAGSFDPPTTWGTVASQNALRFADIDGDQRADAVVRDPATGAVTFSSSKGGQFDAAQPLGNWVGATLDAADISGDGRSDLVGHNVLGASLQAALSGVKTPLGVPADVDPPTGVDIEPDVLTAPAGSGVSAAAAAPVIPPPPPEGYPALGMEDEAALTKRATYDPFARRDTDAETDHYYRRLREAGVTVVRLKAYWGGIENRPQGSGWRGGRHYNWDSIDAAVEAARRNNLSIHMTFTGTAHPGNKPTASINECSATGNMDGIGCDANGVKTATGVAPDPGQFGNFVEDGVRRYTRNGNAVDIDVMSFGIWNEPNLKGWLRAEANGSTIPTGLYRSLYQQAYAGWRNATKAIPNADPALDVKAVKGTQILIGELSSASRSGANADTLGTCLTGMNRNRCRWTPLDFLEAVVKGASNGVRASGVALHPYQDWTRPDHQETEYKQDGTPLKGANLNMGISRLGPFFRGYEASLCDPVSSKCTGKLRAPAGSMETDGHPANLPGLYLTEFGYLNQPTTRADLGARADANRYWHTEVERRNWLEGTADYEGALRKARRSTAFWFVLYHALEHPPTQPPFTANNPDKPTSGDYGLFGKYDANFPGDDIAGERDYGKRRVSRKHMRYEYRHPQRRRAYCAIRKWAINNHYFKPDEDDPATPELDNRRNRCPTGHAAWFDSD